MCEAGGTGLRPIALQQAEPRLFVGEGLHHLWADVRVKKLRWEGTLNGD